MSVDQASGAIFGALIFVALCMLAAQILPSPINVPWSVFMRGALFAVGAGVGVIAISETLIWLTT